MKCMAVAPTPRQGRAAFITWLTIRESDLDAVKRKMAASTFSRHLKILRAAGITDEDLHGAAIKPFRRRVIVAEPVESWEDLRRLAAGKKPSEPEG